MALEVKLGQDLRLRQQLVMTPQLQQAIKILQLSLPELEAVVQSELEQNPVLEPLDSSPAENAPENSSNSDEEFTPISEGELHEEFPGDLAALDRVVPRYEWFDGWMTPTAGARNLADLPAEARRYLDRMRELVDAPITYVSVGTRRDQIIGL